MYLLQLQSWSRIGATWWSRLRGRKSWILDLWQHLSNTDDCLEDKREDYRNYSVLYVVYDIDSCAQCDAHTYEQTNRSLDWVLSHWAHFTVLRFSFVYVCKCMYFLYDCIFYECVVIVTWWGGPGGIEARSLGAPFPSMLCHCWLGHLTRKNCARYDLWCV